MTKYKWEVGKTYKTIDGRNAKLLHILEGGSGNSLVFVMTDKEGKEYIAQRKTDGKLGNSDTYGGNVIPPEPERKSGFVTVYEGMLGNSYSTRPEAESMATNEYQGILEVCFEDGEFVGTVYHPRTKVASK